MTIRMGGSLKMCLGLVKITDNSLEVTETWAVKFQNFLVSTPKNFYLSEIFGY